MDIYIVMDGARVVGASTKLQGAENIRIDAARERANWGEYACGCGQCIASYYDRMAIVNIDPTTITFGEPIPADRLAAIFDAIDAGRALTEAR